MTETITYTDRERWGSLGSVLFGHFADGFDLVLISYLFSPLAYYFTGNPHDLAPITLALTISLVFSAFGGLLFGWIADRYGRKVGLMLSIGIFGLTTLAIAGVTQLWQLYTLRAIEGLGIGGEWGIGFAQISEVWSKKTRATGGGLLQSVFIIGSIAGAITAGIAIQTLGFGNPLTWRYSFVVAGVIGLIGVPIVKFVLPESKQWLEYNRKRKAGELPKDYDVRSPILQVLTSKDYRRYAWVALLIGGANLFIYFSYASFMPTLLIDSYHLVNSVPILINQFTMILVIGQAIAVPFYVLNGWAADRFGRKSTAFVFGTFYLVSVIAFLYTVLAHVTYASLIMFPLFYAYTFVSIGQGVSAEYGVWYSEHFPTKMRSTATNFGYMVGRGVAGGSAPLVIPALYGALGGITHLGMAMGIAMLVGAVVQLIGYFGLRETKGTELTSL